MDARVAISSFVAATLSVVACASSTSRPRGTGGASSSSASSSSSSSSSGGVSDGAGGACASELQAFGVCDGDRVLDAGPGDAAPGDPCATAADCAAVCCLCPEGQDRYAYAACSCGRCASVCDPVNDTRAPVCQDAGPLMSGCWKCSQILNEALDDGENFGPIACPGGATNAWNALAACAGGACGPACDAGVMPTDSCVGCLEAPDDAGGCASEFSSCAAQ